MQKARAPCPRGYGRIVEGVGKAVPGPEGESRDRTEREQEIFQLWLSGIPIWSGRSHGADGRSRTSTFTLVRWRSSIKLHPHCPDLGTKDLAKRVCPGAPQRDDGRGL